MDMRTYNKIKFFAHAEENNVAYPLADDDLSMFIRLGTDYNLNYYEYEIPLKVTPWEHLQEMKCGQKKIK